MRIFKYKTFVKWAKKQGMSDDDLKKSIVEIQTGLIDANLGGDVYKKRIGIHGRGKRSSHRTIILMKIGNKAIFAHGFSKGEKDNIEKNELEGFKVMAEAFLSLNDEQLTVLIDKQSLVEVFLNE
ncbi:type II toxin-antitoxin system RelE/ParE family toxin [Methyloprofundus sp.]|uniref:type II toxin-antitoxin system RelE/ParE family toxin n=1 Tax=Methyloprofundus sp. TaxID=2020875 RepID=UPI003D0B21C7